jgi:hypothetical protein
VKFLPLLALACGTDLPQVPDAGSPCSCAHAGSYWYETTGDTTTVLETCVDHTPVNTCGLTKGDAGCSGVTLLLGAGACTWEAP